jgi:hypothetical protein
VPGAAAPPGDFDFLALLEVVLNGFAVPPRVVGAGRFGQGRRAGENKKEENQNCEQFFYIFASRDSSARH